VVELLCELKQRFEVIRDFVLDQLLVLGISGIKNGFIGNQGAIRVERRLT